ncbi:MAG: hypothetical protein WBP75_15365 [Candidatus Cybelea sp.]
MLNLCRYAVVSSTVAVLLAACGGSQSGQSMPGLAPRTAATDSREQSRAWMADGIANRDLLYVSNGTTVDVYRYWQRTQVGNLTGFISARGECVDSADNVYITDSKANDVVEYAHGGTKPIQIFKAHTPLRCAVSPLNGDLAIANWKFGVSIYRPGKKRPIVYTGLYRYAAVGYDNDGDLLVTTGCTIPSSSCPPAGFAYLPRTGRKLISIDIRPYASGYFLHPTDILWDGKDWVVGQAPGLYRYRITGSKVRYVGKTGLDHFLSGAAIYNPTAEKQGTEAVGPAAVRGSSKTGTYRYMVDFWNYPSGGYPIELIDVPGGPVAISCARVGCERKPRL